MEKKTEKKAVLKFVLLILISAALGAGASMLMGWLTHWDGISFQRLGDMLGAMVPWVFLLTNLISAIAAMLICHRAKKQIGQWDGEDECIEQTEQQLSCGLLLANIMTVVNFFLFSAGIEVSLNTKLGDQYGVILFPACILIFILGYVWIFFVNYRVVKLEKQINPEKRGSVFDVKFQKQWLESCDEAEKLMVYRCGFRAYQVGNKVCMGLWLVALFLQLWADTGLFPVLSICVIWLSMVAAYVLASIRLERHK